MGQASGRPSQLILLWVATMSSHVFLRPEIRLVAVEHAEARASVSRAGWCAISVIRSQHQTG